jgi:hypothetical protein
MPGLVPNIHAFLASKDVDGLDKPGHDAKAVGQRGLPTLCLPIMLIGAHSYPAHSAGVAVLLSPLPVTSSRSHLRWCRQAQPPVTEPRIMARMVPRTQMAA